MQDFEFYNPTRVVFGRGGEKHIGALVRPYAGKVLLHYGSDRVKKSGLFDAVTESLRAAGVDCVELGGVVPNPRLSLVREGAALCRRESVELVLAVGGGSVIDSAKAIAVAALSEREVWDYFAADIPVERALPVAAVLTIPAAGSESSPSMVITNGETGQKFGRTAEAVYPVVSVVNPELFSTLPKNQIANGVADMTSHIFERYFTNTPHTDLTDGLCEAALRTIMKNAPKVLADPADYDAWCEVAFGGTVAHNGLLGMGRAQDWACHGMEHELSARYDVAHGAGLAVLTPAWIRTVWMANPSMFAQFAVKVMGVDGGFRDVAALVEEGVVRLKGFYASLGLPGTLREMGIGEEHLEEMAERAVSRRPLGGLKRLDRQDVLTIYRRAL